MYVSDKRNTETYGDAEIKVNVEKPINWGEGYAVELAIGILEDRYYKFYGKKYVKPR